MQSTFIVRRSYVLDEKMRLKTDLILKCVGLTIFSKDILDLKC